MSDEPPRGSPSDDAVAAPSPKAQSASRGLAFITLAKLWFMVGGAAIGFLLPRMFPKAVGVERYGEWGTVLAWMSVMNNVIVTGTIQMVSRFASRGPAWVVGTKRAALSVNAVLVTSLAVGYGLLAPAIAGFEHDQHLVPLLRLSTGVVVCYGLYAVFVGAANGAREFHKQAGLDMGFTTLRAVFVLAGALLFATVQAALGGFVLAAAAILCCSVAVVGAGGTVEERPRAGDLVAFVAPVSAYLAVLNALMFVDYWWLKRLLAEGASAAGALPIEAAHIADAAVGKYNAALQIARLPYQAILAVTFVIFPLVSQAEFAADRDKTRDYIARSLRLSLLVVTLLATAVAARPEALLALLFPKNGVGANEYVQAAPALAFLMFGYVAFSLLSIAGTILNGAGAAGPALAIGAVTLAVDAGITYAAITWAMASGATSPLTAAAAGSAVGIGLGLVMSLAWLSRRFGASLPPITAVRVAVAAAGGVLVGRLLPAQVPGALGHLVRLAACGLGALVYAGLLVATREATPAELRALLRRKR